MQAKGPPLNECRFVFSRTGGRGGQKVNKTSSRVTVLWCPLESAAYSGDEKDRIAGRLSGHLSLDGCVSVHADETRSQTRNRELAYSRLCELVEAALRVPKRRKRSGVSKGQKAARLEQKKRRAARLRNRHPD